MNLIKLFAPLLCYICFARTVWCLGFKDVILEPLDKSAGEDICVIFMQGADITPLQYVPLLKLVQEELSEYRVWVSYNKWRLNSTKQLKQSENFGYRWEFQTISKILSTLSTLTEASNAS